jgi:hypothetical protein
MRSFSSGGNGGVHCSWRLTSLCPAMRYRQLAAEQALLRSGQPETITYCNKEIELLAHLPATPARAQSIGRRRCPMPSRRWNGCLQPQRGAWGTATYPANRGLPPWGRLVPFLASRRR